MKYAIATVVLGALGVCVLGASEIHAQRAGQTTAMLHGTVLAMSQGQLAAAHRACEPSAAQSAALVAYCTEVQRVLESQPLQVVVRPPAFTYF